MRFAWEARIGDYVGYPMPGTRGVLNDGEMGVVISYSGLTDAARKFAREHFITEVDGDRIAALVWRHRAKLAKRWPQLFAGK